MSMLKKSVSVIGLGYVGLPLALLAAKRGWQVHGIDIDQKKVDLINQNKSLISASTDFSFISTSSVVVICVPTPVLSNRLPDYSPVKSACKSVGTYLQPGQLIILESTVNPGASEEIVIPVLEQVSHLSAGKDFYLAHCPERINPGDPDWNVNNIPRVIGALNPISLSKALTFYKSVIDAPLTTMSSLKAAEAVKVVENSFRNINIAFVNELAQSFALLDIDTVEVIDGAATKPFAFMPHYPGCGIGGHCIPVDPYYLIDYAQKTTGFEHRFLKLGCETNEHMPEYTVNLVAAGLKKLNKSLSSSQVTVFGLAYKPNLADCRESPAFKIIDYLSKKGAKVVTYDPYVPEHSTAKSLNSALIGSQAIIIATAHTQFIKLSADRIKKSGVLVVIDGRNCLPAKKFLNQGLYFKGIGR